MELQKLINELRRAAATLEAIANHPEAHTVQPGDIAQLREDGHQDYPGRLVLINRATGPTLRATLLDLHRAGSWGTDLLLMPAQLHYVGTPKLQESPLCVETNASARTANMQPARALPGPALPAPGQAPKRKPPTTETRRSTRRQANA